MARFRQSPNYIAKKSLWPAFDWWNILFYMVVIPTLIIVLQISNPDLCSLFIALALYALVPLTLIFMSKKITWWNLLFFIIIPAIVVAALYFVLPPLYETVSELFSSWWVVLGAWCVFPITICVVKVIILRHKYIEFYDNCVIERWGVFNKHTKKTVFPEVTAVTTQKNILGYGDVFIDVVGPWDVKFDDMSKPDDLRDYLVYHMLNDAAVENISNNPYIAATDGIF